MPSCNREAGLRPARLELVGLATTNLLERFNEVIRSFRGLAEIE
jgi:hypothetical protein